MILPQFVLKRTPTHRKYKGKLNLIMEIYLKNNAEHKKFYAVQELHLVVHKSDNKYQFVKVNEFI